jgi:Holliday junction resolvase RusA-like endonuclease
MKEVKFTIPGPPFGKQRPKFTSVGKFAKAYTPEKTQNYETFVKWCYQEKCNFRFEDGAMLDVRILAYYSIPKSTSKKKRALMLEHKIRPTKKPDWDNIGKIVCDSLNEIAYKDDRMVVDAQVRKFYSDNPRVEVIIREVE